MQKIDAEIKRLVEEGYNEATRILTERRADLEKLARGLLEFETLAGEEIKDLLDGKQSKRNGATVGRAGSPNGEPGACGRWVETWRTTDPCISVTCGHSLDDPLCRTARWF